jgi:hypothetical protein
MERYQITTMVDITRTRPTRSDTDHLRQSQQANFNSLTQAINLRAMIIDDIDPVRETGRLPDPWTGKAAHWIYEFTVEREDVFWDDGDPVSLLKQDLDGVPIIPQLNNTADFTVPVFKTTGDKINTIIQKLA